MSDFENLQQLCETADELSKKYISSSSPDFKAWKTRADRLLIRRFGKDSYEFKSFNKNQLLVVFLHLRYARLGFR